MLLLVLSLKSVMETSATGSGVSGTCRRPLQRGRGEGESSDKSTMGNDCGYRILCGTNQWRLSKEDRTFSLLVAGGITIRLYKI